MMMTGRLGILALTRASRSTPDTPRHADVAHEHHGRRVFKRLQYGLRLLEKPAFDARLESARESTHRMA